MTTEDKNRTEVFSRIAADFLEQLKGDGEAAAKIQRLRSDVTKAVESEDTVFGKFRVLMESFKEIIPEEKQRYHAALKALQTTAKLSREEVIAAIGSQLEELKALEKDLTPGLPGRNEINAMESKAQEMKAEIAKLREIVGRLENEEKAMLSSITARKKEVDVLGKSVGEVFTAIRAEMTSIKSKIEEFTAERPAAQPAAPPIALKKEPPAKKEAPVKREIFPNTELFAADAPAPTEPDGQNIELVDSSPQQDTEWQKKCSMCGGRMNYHAMEEKWMCYSCGNEEVGGDIPGKSDKKRADNGPSEAMTDQSTSSSPAGLMEEAAKGSLLSSEASKRKACPACRKQMNWYEMEKAWRCSFCEYERRI